MIPTNPRALRSVRRRERGVALIMVMLTAAIAVLALPAVFLTSSGILAARSADTERTLRTAMDVALANGKARLTSDSALVLPDTGFVTLLSNAEIRDADGRPLSGVKVSVYAGRTESTTGDPGAYASLVADARAARGKSRIVRRLELAAESFARFAMFTNRWRDGCFTTGAMIRGRAHSNEDWVSCGRPMYLDTVSAAGSVTGGSPDFRRGALDGVPPIPLPSAERLTSLHGHAVPSGFDIVALGATLAEARTRIEFVTVDTDDDGDVYDESEGFFRVFNAHSPDEARAAFVSGVRDRQCGDWHDVDPSPAVELAFFPIAVHDAPWFARLGHADAGGPIDDAKRHEILAGAGSRCWPAGDPHLVAVERAGIAGYEPGDWEKGGDDTTFTAKGNSGSWSPFPGASPALLSSIPEVRQASEAAYLWPLDRTLHPGSRGVIHVHGPVLLSGVLRGRVTLYSSGSVGLVDDLVYAQDPATALCANVFGVIAESDVTILDNGINSPQSLSGRYLWTDDDTDFVLHGVVMSRGGSFGVENWSAHPESMKRCNGILSGRGCIVHTGGVIQDHISITSDGAGSGLIEQRSSDRCLASDAPPFFPLTGRYTEQRFHELDPERFDPATFFRPLQPRF